MEKEKVYLIGGEEYTRNEIEKAFEENRIAITTSHGSDGGFVDVLRICDYPEEAEALAEYDTRGLCYSMSEEVWGRYPKDLKEVYKLAFMGGSISF